MQTCNRIYYSKIY